MLSVTEVLDYFLDPVLVEWMLREGKVKCERVSTEAKRVGHAVEALIYADIRGLNITLPTSDEPVMNGLQAWQRFKEAHPLFVSTVTGVQTELTDGSIIGHPDLEVMTTQGWGIIDLKTSKAIQPKYWTQVCQYAELKQRQFSLPPPAFVGILRLDKITAQPDYQLLTDLAEIEYEQDIFTVYYHAYRHSQHVQDRLRAALEEEVLHGI